MSYYALSNVNHNGKEFGRGDEVTDLSPEQAAGLIEFGVVSETAPEAVEAAPATPAVVDHPAITEAANAAETAPVVAADPLVEPPTQPEVSTPAPVEPLQPQPAPVSVKVEKLN